MAFSLFPSMTRRSPPFLKGGFGGIFRLSKEGLRGTYEIRQIPPHPPFQRGDRMGLQRPKTSSTRTMSDSSGSPIQISMTRAGSGPTPRRRWRASRGMKISSFGVGRPDPLADGHLEARVEGDPELGPAVVELERQAPAGLDGDDLDGRPELVGVGPELPPGPDVFEDALPEDLSRSSWASMAVIPEPSAGPRSERDVVVSAAPAALGPFRRLPSGNPGRRRPSADGALRGPLPRACRGG